MEEVIDESLLDEFFSMNILTHNDFKKPLRRELQQKPQKGLGGIIFGCSGVKPGILRKTLNQWTKIKYK